ncbi:MAG: hypothetical protein J1E37_01415 [Prevotella sp.]|nr:hypothetical protein [Prevotella sp.]
MKQSNKRTISQSQKNRMGAIGESNVVSQLMQHGWDAFNANCTIKNFKSIDIVCLNGNDCDEKTPWRPKTALIQVKTCSQRTIPMGFTIRDCLDRNYLERSVMGPYVFVHAKENEDGKYSFRYFIISREDFIELAYRGHLFYVYDYERKHNKQPFNDENYINGVSINSPAGLKVSWLEGFDELETKNHKHFENPLKGVSCENAWENIWK